MGRAPIEWGHSHTHTHSGELCFGWNRHKHNPTFTGDALHQTRVFHTNTRTPQKRAGTHAADRSSVVHRNIPDALPAPGGHLTGYLHAALVRVGVVRQASAQGQPLNHFCRSFLLDGKKRPENRDKRINHWSDGSTAQWSARWAASRAICQPFGGR